MLYKNPYLDFAAYEYKRVKSDLVVVEFARVRTHLTIESEFDALHQRVVKLIRQSVAWLTDEIIIFLLKVLVLII
jgi:hypothetical protein